MVCRSAPWGAARFLGDHLDARGQWIERLDVIDNGCFIRIARTADTNELQLRHGGLNWLCLCGTKFLLVLTLFMSGAVSIHRRTLRNFFGCLTRPAFIQETVDGHTAPATNPVLARFGFRRKIIVNQLARFRYLRCIQHENTRVECRNWDLGDVRPARKIFQNRGDS